ncbi:MAG: DUF5615 family PIN-like protein [Planctomycetales bacterium]|nr:DUF5615 family PIN-like protein [Planctomycetales bacterium]
MTALRFFTDEDIYGAIAPALRDKGIDAMAARETGRLGDSDESQLTWASNNQRAIVTFNVADFVRLHTQWLMIGQHHCGIVVSTQRPIGDLLIRLLNLASSTDQSSMKDRLDFLSDW